MFRSKYILFALTSVAVVLFSACEEEGPIINLGDGNQALVDTSYVDANVETAQDKNVLVEEFTGVRCSNCPNGHDAIKNLLQQHGNRLVAVSMHNEDIFTPPYDDEENLAANGIATDIVTFLGMSPFKPSAMIDRTEFQASTLSYGISEWAGHIDTRLAMSTPVNITLEKNFDAAARTGTVKMTLHYTANVSEDHRFTLLLVENDIRTKQKQPDQSVVENYPQNEVIRFLISGSSTGEAISETLEPGRTIIKEYRIEDLPAHYNVENMDVVAYVHESGTTQQVVHAHHIHLVD